MVDRRAIGTWRGVAIDVAGWDGVGARVDLSCACMFSREMPGKMMAGGLLHLDQALGGVLSQLRSEGTFEARLLDFLLLSSPPTTIAAGAMLVIGLGDPESWVPSSTARAVSGALQVAVQRSDSTVAFAPSLLDAGLPPRDDTASAMLGELAKALDAIDRLVVLELAARPPLTTWTFDAGLAHLDGTEAAFLAAFARLPRQLTDV